eukprot:2531058-Pyramimonas_sp.AAC.1
MIHAGVLAPGLRVRERGIPRVWPFTGSSNDRDVSDDSNASMSARSAATTRTPTTDVSDNDVSDVSDNANAYD